jgi:hypothetical protein
MTIESLVSRNDYTGTGSVSVYAYGFKIIEDTDLLVTVQDGTTGVEETLVLGLDYSVDGMGDETGGDVTLSSDLTAGDLLTIRRVVPLLQETDIRNQGSYAASLHEDVFDHLCMIDQQQQDSIDRSLRLPETEADLYELPTATQRANKFLAFDADGEPIASAGGIDDAIPVTSYIETLLDDTDATTARATLNITDAIPAGTHMVFVDSTVPTGWILDPDALNDKAFRVVSGSTTTPGHADTGGVTGGTIAVSTGFAHTHTVAAHAHIVPSTAVQHKHQVSLSHTASGSASTWDVALMAPFGLGSTIGAGVTADYYAVRGGTIASSKYDLTDNMYNFPSGTTRNTENGASISGSTYPNTDSKLGVLAHVNVIVGVKA